MGNTTISIDEHTKKIIKEHSINLSEYVRNKIREEYGNIEILEQKIEELRTKANKIEAYIERIKSRENQIAGEKAELDQKMTDQAEEQFWEGILSLNHVSVLKFEKDHALKYSQITGKLMDGFMDEYTRRRTK